MSTQEAIVAVLVAAIFANLVLAIGLIVSPRLRARRGRAAAAAARNVEESTTAIPRALGGGRPLPVGPGPSFGPPTLVPSERRGSSPSGAPGGAPADSLTDENADLPPTDPVTGFELVASWTKWLAEESSRIHRYGRPATIVLVELAGVDRLADRLGPEAADRLIPPIATTMRRHARAADNLARLGRARFGALLTETDEIRAINYVERVRSACDVWLESGAVALRLSIGWAEIGANQPVEVAIQVAERRLNEERIRLRERSDYDAEAESDVQASVMESTRT